MAYTNFIPTVWAEQIQRELDEKCVFVEDCNRQYEGKVKELGDSVTILGVGSPTIKELNRSQAGNDIDGPEEVESTSAKLYVNHLAYFNYKVADIDKAQAVNGLMDALNVETTEKLANVIDRYIGGFAIDSSVEKVFGTTQLITAGTTSSSSGMNVLEVLDEAIQKLYERNVSDSTKIVATVSPRFYTLFKRAYGDKDTNNSMILKNGKVGMYGHVTIKMSNHICRTDDNATDNIMIRTQRAVAFVKPHVHTEPYRPEKSFSDAVKGYVLYEGKVIRPKEILNINVKYA